MSANDTSSAAGAGPGHFLTTRWSVVLSAGRSDSTRAQTALAQLCQTYWYPLYAYVRRRGYPQPDAEDLTQAFFAKLLEKRVFLGVAPERGKFRSYLLAALNHFLADEWERARTQKRGGGPALSLDTLTAESRLSVEPADRDTPEKAYDRAWALTLLEKVYARLKAEYEASPKSGQFAALKFCLTGERSQVPYTELAQQLGMSEGAVKVAVHRLRERYRELLREEIAQTVATPAEVEEELRGLFRAVAN